MGANRIPLSFSDEKLRPSLRRRIRAVVIISVPRARTTDSLKKPFVPGEIIDEYRVELLEGKLGRIIDEVLYRFEAIDKISETDEGVFNPVVHRAAAIEITPALKTVTDETTRERETSGPFTFIPDSIQTSCGL